MHPSSRTWTPEIQVTDECMFNPLSHKNSGIGASLFLALVKNDSRQCIVAKTLKICRARQVFERYTGAPGMNAKR